LYRELEELEDCKIPIDAIRENAETAERAAANPEQEASEIELPDKFRHYNPSVIDFIRRCDNELQAEEIITYMQKRGEITEEYAEQLKRQLRDEGVRSFGTKKEDNYYFKQSGLC
jgi:hypothetical protein